MDLREAVQNSYFVHGLEPAEIDSIVAIAQVRQFDGGATIVRQFEKTFDLMIVLSGGARINTFSGDNIVEVGPGGVIGEISFLDERPRSATVMSAGATAVAVIPAAALREVWHENPNIELAMLRNLTRVLCDHVRLNNMQLEGGLGRR